MMDLIDPVWPDFCVGLVALVFGIRAAVMGRYLWQAGSSLDDPYPAMIPVYGKPARFVGALHIALAVLILIPGPFVQQVLAIVGLPPT